MRVVGFITVFMRKSWRVGFPGEPRGSSVTVAASDSEGFSSPQLCWSDKPTSFCLLCYSALGFPF